MNSALLLSFLLSFYAGVHVYIPGPKTVKLKSKLETIEPIRRRQKCHAADCNLTVLRIATDNTLKQK